MSRYKFNTEKFKSFKNSGGGKRDKNLLCRSVLHAKDNLIILKEMLEKIVPNIFGKYVFAMIYKDIPPKSRRFSFGTIFQNISDIPQRSILVSDGEETTTKLYYELSLPQFNWLKKVLSKAIEIKSSLDFLDNDYDAIKKMFGDKKK